MSNPITIDQIARTLLDQGYSPVDIRKQLAKRGARWAYSFSGIRPDGTRASHQGNRERARRLKAAGLCSSGDGSPREQGHDLCMACLRKKWGLQS